MSAHGPHRLASWKEIAAYLQREVRTVIRWEKDRGLPVHRVPGGQGRSVFAFTDELDRWAAGQLTNEAASVQPARRFQSRHVVAAAIVAACAISAAVFGPRAVIAWSKPDIVAATIAETTIDAVARGGRPTWSFALPGRAQAIPGRQTATIDLTGDGRRDVLASVNLAATLDDTPDGALYALDTAGQPLWARSLGVRLSYRAGDFDAPWQPDDLMAFKNGDEAFVAWSVHHLIWWPSMLAVFDARGARVGTFANAGWIRMSRPTVDGRHIVTAGFSNSRGGAAFAVLDARHPDGSSPEDPGSPFECRNCPAGSPLRYFVVDWSDIASTLPPDERVVSVAMPPTGHSIELHAQQRRGVELVVELSPTFEIVRRSATDTYWEWHRRLEIDGTIDHSRDRCPYRDGPIVREWTPAGGWKIYGRLNASVRP